MKNIVYYIKKETKNKNKHHLPNFTPLNATSLTPTLSPGVPRRWSSKGVDRSWAWSGDPASLEFFLSLSWLVVFVGFWVVFVGLWVVFVGLLVVFVGFLVVSVGVLVVFVGFSVDFGGVFWSDGVWAGVPRYFHGVKEWLSYPCSNKRGGSV